MTSQNYQFTVTFQFKISVIKDLNPLPFTKIKDKWKHIMKELEIAKVKFSKEA